MKKTLYTEEQVAFALKQAETGIRMEEMCSIDRYLFTSMDYLRFASTESGSDRAGSTYDHFSIPCNF